MFWYWKQWCDTEFCNSRLKSYDRKKSIPDTHYVCYIQQGIDGMIVNWFARISHTTLYGYGHKYGYDLHSGMTKSSYFLNLRVYHMKKKPGILHSRMQFFSLRYSDDFQWF